VCRRFPQKTSTNFSEKRRRKLSLLLVPSGYFPLVFSHKISVQKLGKLMRRKKYTFCRENACDYRTFETGNSILIEKKKIWVIRAPYVESKVKTSLRTPQRYWPVEVKFYIYFQYGPVVDKVALALRVYSKISFHQFSTFKTSIYHWSYITLALHNVVK
jgi:hypothetical protein